MDYNPKPLDDRSVSLPEDLKPLTELLSKNVHEVWAAGRLADGWKYGPVRDDKKKEHPSLVPYDHLPEREKDYDRATALSTIKLIIKLGYRIEKP